MYLCVKVLKDETTLSGRAPNLVCVKIPIIIPDPPIPILDPRNPGDWITGAQIDVQQARDLSVLATVHKLVGQLSPQLQGVLEAPVKQAFKTIELPKFATLSFDKQVEKEYK